MNVSARRKGLLKLKPAAAIALLAMCWLTAAIVMWGCGKKGPPKPPSGRKPPAVRDLAYSITATTIKLSWTVPQPNAKAKSAVSGFLVYRYQQAANERECSNCPVIFKQIGDVPGPKGGSGTTPLFYTQTLQPGYRYIFKVKAYDDEGLFGRDSNFVQFEF